MRHSAGRIGSHMGGVLEGSKKFIHVPLRFVRYTHTKLARWVEMKYAGWLSYYAPFGLQRVSVGEMELIARNFYVEMKRRSQCSCLIDLLGSERMLVRGIEVGRYLSNSSVLL